MKIDQKMIEKAIEAVLKFFNKEIAKPVQPIVATPVPKVEVVSVTLDDLGPLLHQVDWANPQSKISKYFTVNEAIQLREWKRLANESDGLDDKVKENLYSIFQKMDTIREFLGKPVYIRSAYRPGEYNVAIGGAKRSAHIADAEYAAVDFWCDMDSDGDKDGEDCDLIKVALMNKLEGWGLRMEDNGKGARWVHLDNKPVPPGGNRFFKP